MTIKSIIKLSNKNLLTPSIHISDFSSKKLKEIINNMNDNASFYKSSEIEELAQEYGCYIIFLPPYSPDLNPIEKVWANLKRNIKKFINFREAITYAIGKSFLG